ncbi:UNVERIFIED_ORG: hypothetical protein ABIB19_003308 [Arthrobacter sp. UYEF10]
MDEPVERVQSLISTANPNAVVTRMPGKHINASITGPYRHVAAVAVT